MKKLTNTSPFLLLLVPVFIMMVLMLSTAATDTHNSEFTLKPTSSTAVAKIAVQQAK